jgi:hypothetical protein
MDDFEPRLRDELEKVADGISGVHLEARFAQRLDRRRRNRRLALGSIVLAFVLVVGLASFAWSRGVRSTPSAAGKPAANRAAPPSSTADTAPVDTVLRLQDLPPRVIPPGSSLVDIQVYAPTKISGTGTVTWTSNPIPEKYLRPPWGLSVTTEYVGGEVKARPRAQQVLTPQGVVEKVTYDVSELSGPGPFYIVSTVSAFDTRDRS